MSRATFALFTAGLAAVATAYTTPVGDPSGNPISKPGLNDVVVAGTSYPITWNPTTEGVTVSLVLCKGPSTNCVTQTPAIVEGIKNTGSYSWSVPSTLEPTTGGVGYGIQLIVDGTGQYQYSTQFGISNPSYGSSSSSSSSSASAVTSSSTKKSSTKTSSASSTEETICTDSTTASSSTLVTVTSTSSPSVTATIGSTGSVPNTVIQPTGTMSVPTSLRPTATTSTFATGAAPTVAAAGLKLAAVIGMGVGALVL